MFCKAKLRELAVLRLTLGQTKKPPQVVPETALSLPPIWYDTILAHFHLHVHGISGPIWRHFCAISNFALKRLVFIFKFFLKIGPNFR